MANTKDLEVVKNISDMYESKKRYLESVGEFTKNDSSRSYRIKEEYKHLTPSDLSRNNNKWSEYNVAQSKAFINAVREEIKIKDIKQTLKELAPADKSAFTREELDKEKEYLDKIGYTNKYTKEYRVNEQFRDIARKDLNSVQDKENGEKSIAITKEFREKLSNYLDKKLEANKEQARSERSIYRSQGIER